MKKRIGWIDITRGIGMLLIIIGHTLGPYTFSTVARVIFAVHVPVFFVLSGYLFSQKDWKTIFSKLNRNLLLPYIATCFIMIVANWIALHHQNPFIVAKIQTHQFIIAALYGVGTNTAIPFMNQTVFAIGAIWFLVAMYIGDLMFNLSFKIADRFKSTKLILLLSLAECILGFILASKIHFILPWSISAALESQAFYCGGYLIRKSNLIERSFVYPIIGIVLWGISAYTGFFYLNTGYAANPFFAILGGIGGSFTLMVLSKYLELILSKIPLVLKAIQKFGQLSLLVLCGHIFDLNILGLAGIVYNQFIRNSEIVATIVSIGYRILFVSLILVIIPRIPFIRSFFLNRQYPFNFNFKNKLID